MTLVKNIVSALKVNLRSTVTITVFAISALTLLAARKVTDPVQTIIWKLENTNKVGDYPPVVLGNPVTVSDSSGAALSFNGVNDGLIIPKIPVEGWSRFTIEVLFKPAGDGPAAPRFIHFQDNESNRGTLEVRITPKGMWYLDSFLKNGNTDKGNSHLTLIDSTKKHQADQWYWVALIYDDKKMSSYINGKKELEGIVDFPPMTSGNISIGVRLNKVNWFKGLIKEIRFHPAALDSLTLQH